ncbi:hypothetical protein DCC81_06585 [Chitinophaga parva]|uniref:Uncharacterized protein n=1 Tax=Chitinophaga parva TaxID=2169414 RepID=A0A2T7BN84_9BACT|nr:hypothetical protein [Chitinophaga parva]PUZ29126.1 hypothetical protein DCC81_06585 [Chitinophaga parva]
MEAPKTQPPQEIEELLNAKQAGREITSNAGDPHLDEEDFVAGQAEVLRKAAEKQSNTNVFGQEEAFTLDQISTGIRLEYLRTLRQNNGQRKIYARLIFVFTCLWAAVIFVMLFLAGFKRLELSDTVLVALITTTTINFFGFFLLVVKYLFNTGSLPSTPDGPPQP